MRMRTSLRERRRQVIYVVPNLLTTGNLFCGLYAIMAVFGANYVKAAIAILVALIFDVLDGQSARWTKTTSQFGIEYDSLADLVSFGVAPGVLIYSWALNEYGLLGLAMIFAFVGCGALRLARYNVLTGTTDNRYFMGLPIPAAAGVLASLMLLDHHILRVGKEVKPVLTLIVTLALAFLMVSTVRYTKFKGVKFLAGEGFMYLVWGVLVIMLIAAAPQIALFALFAGYALSGVVMLAFGLVRRAVRRGGEPERMPVDWKK
ncbi:MAG TPA: CDP-diacylglycerol--serine O-phosphatidyltransferase [Nitrospirales bacterium]|nr:CDP-diacylglycerol--serine O-phosphatidyltransferase [Nitrospirales bacterium]